MKKFKILTILFSISLFLNSCAQTTKLTNGTKVLTKKFKNINKFDASTLKNIDINYFYEKVDFYMADKNFNKIREIGSDTNRKIQFYKNGRVRFFSLGIEDANPQNAGRRGIIFKRDNSLLINSQTANQDGDLSVGTYKVKVLGEKIYLLDIPSTLFFKPSEYICYEYVKTYKIPEDWKKYSTDW